MKTQFKLAVVVNGVPVAVDDLAECCEQACGWHHPEELSECVECGQRFCLRHDCSCVVDLDTGV